MVIDRHSEDIASRLVDYAEPVALASLNVLNEEWHFWTTLEAANPIESTRIRDRYDTGRNITGEQGNA